MIKPTVGRKVWYRHDGSQLQAKDGDTFYPAAYNQLQAMDATVIYVWNDRLVNLDITDHAGNRFIRTNVTLVQEGDETPNWSHAEWMPYQQGQAKKDSVKPADDIDAMVSRFLGWKLPADFSPDCGISFKRESDYEHPEHGRTKFEPIGTNLFTAIQARAMFEHALGIKKEGQ